MEQSIPMTLTRRSLLLLSAAAAAGCATSPLASKEPTVAVHTVLGPVDPASLGLFLPHEHLFLDFSGADAVDPARWDEEAAFAAVLPHLDAARAQGVTALAECTPAGIGRNPRLLKRLSAASGVHILTNTGYYTAAGGRFLPPGAEKLSADEMAALWHAEWRDGIEGTGIRPGFIKIAVDAGPLNPVAERVVRAAARLHRRTGLVIGSHTGDAEALRAQLAVLREEGVDPSAFIWIHAQLCRDPEEHLAAARAGAWVEFDGLAPLTVPLHLAMAGELREEGLLHRCLLSHDAGWHDAAIPGGGDFRPFKDLVESWIPAAREAGWSPQEIAQVTRENPARAFTRVLG
jgi:phosphotriesterase-related protein